MRALLVVTKFEATQVSMNRRDKEIVVYSYTGIKMNELHTHISTQINIENTILNEKTNCVIIIPFK